MTARLIEVIETDLDHRGNGRDECYRRIKQYWSTEGTLLAEVDPMSSSEASKAASAAFERLNWHSEQLMVARGEAATLREENERLKGQEPITNIGHFARRWMEDRKVCFTPDLEAAVKTLERAFG